LTWFFQVSRVNKLESKRPQPDLRGPRFMLKPDFVPSPQNEGDNKHQLLAHDSVHFAGSYQLVRLRIIHDGEMCCYDLMP
jgi:hypothetical protein